MDALIRKRLKPADPFPWEDGAERVDVIIASSSSRAASTATAAGVGEDHVGGGAGGATDSSATAAGATGGGSVDHQTKADDLLRHLLSKAADKSSIPQPSDTTVNDTTARSESSSSTSRIKPKLPTPVLFEAILRQFPGADDEVAADDIVRAVVTKVNAADVPPEITATQLILAALAFFCLKIPGIEHESDNSSNNNDSNNTNTNIGQGLVREAFPCLPLLDNVHGGDALVKITKRKYKRHSSLPFDWSVEDVTVRQKIRNLESAFLTSTLTYPSRYRLCPKICSAAEEREVLLTGVLEYRSAKPAAAATSTSTGAKTGDGSKGAKRMNDGQANDVPRLAPAKVPKITSSNVKPDLV